MSLNWSYQELNKLLKQHELPAMVVNMEILDHNIEYFKKIAEKNGKNIRIATKSIRVPELIKYIQQKGGEKFQQLMCYSVREADFLIQQGFQHIMVAYPSVSDADLRLFFHLTQQNHDIALTIDSVEQIKRIEKVWETNKNATIKAKLCVDVDMSYRPKGLHLGVFRSSILSISEFEEVLNYIAHSDFVKLTGIMGYEAQVAGMGDKNPFQPILNPAKKLIKKLSQKDVAKKRQSIFNTLNNKNIQLEFFNGGGTGSILTTGTEPWITEIAVGSGFLQAHLFDYYEQNSCLPAFAFALQISRTPNKKIVTCKSGGFIASGETLKDKMPLPFLPEGIKITANEGFGEVQTPVIIPENIKVELGDVLLFRPAKSGEIAEHFTHYLLLENNQIKQSVKTYRGFGQCFY